LTSPALSTLAFAAFMSCATAGCAPDLASYREGYGLRPVEIELSDEDEAQLLHSGIDGDTAPGHVKVGRDRLAAWITLSGQASRTQVKRGYSFELHDDVGELGYRAARVSPQAQDRSMLRTLLGLRVFRALGVAAPDVEPIALYVQGEYAGLYLMIERVDSGFFERRGLPVERLYESEYGSSYFDSRMIVDPASGLSAAIGELNKHEVIRMAEWANATPDAANLEEASRIFDLDDLVAFTAAQRFLLNCDSFFNNLYLWKRPEDARFRTAAWDWEKLYHPDCMDGQLETITPLIKQIFAHAELETRISALISGLKQGAFDSASVRALIEADRVRIAGAYAADPHLGGLGKDLNLHANQLFDYYTRVMAGL
jgi:hypothetical protein